MFISEIKNSVEAHIQNLQKTHFRESKYGREILKLKGTHTGEKCFIIGNGPSLSASDLQKLHDYDIITFASNRIYNIFNDTNWRPTYYASEDIIILKDIQEKINNLKIERKFIPINLKWYENIDIKGATYFLMDYDSDRPEIYNLALNIEEGVRCKGTVTITCIQFAIYMGFSEIYLLGVDHSYSKMLDEKGKIVEDNSVKDYFSDKYDVGIKDKLTHDIGSATKAFWDVEQLSQKIKTFRVYNATRGGKLEVFERVDFDEIVSKK